MLHTAIGVSMCDGANAIRTFICDTLGRRSSPQMQSAHYMRYQVQLVHLYAVEQMQSIRATQQPTDAIHTPSRGEELPGEAHKHSLQEFPKEDLAG